MRIRATVAAVTGALALSALAVPAAHAAGPSTHRADAAKIFQAVHAPSTAKAGIKASVAGDDDMPYDLGVTFSNLKVAKALKVGTTNRVSTTITYTMKFGADVDVRAEDFFSEAYLYKGSFDRPQNELSGEDLASCSVTSETTATCKSKIDIYPADGDLDNIDAGTWRAGAFAVALNGQDPMSRDFDLSQVGYAEKGALGTTLVQRNSKLTTSAKPKPVKKGKTVTVTGKLTRANWESGKYSVYKGQAVKLQFKKKGTTTYKTLKTVKANSAGTFKATTKATADGYYRFVFAGNSTTPAVNAAGDLVRVKK
ncbi:MULTISPECIES: hypothetical protein [unclassified Streptomyces]|uniref:hypothetical protein n=1 Tax=unclassified Streptomyces TaxID=2593676 RepID=UPI000C27347D|nr:hypothetical protein [Streptomyces sp. CB01373]PJM95051.1 hypothetical protein CG719_14135 [Streptomyces sp. CB01373]